MKDHYELVILGGGPAGLSAGLYAARARLDHVMLEKGAPGGQVLLTDWVDNYPGFPEGLTGFDLVERMTQHAKRFDLNTELACVTEVDLRNVKRKVLRLDTNLQAALTAAASYTTPYPSTTTPTTGSTVSTESTTPSTQSGNNITTSNTQPLITLNQIPSATVNTSTTTANDSSNQNSSANNKNTQAPVSGTPPVSTPNSEALTLAAQTLKAQINAAIDVYNQYAPNTFVKVS